jgi:peptidyl-dipeptidase A
VVPQKGADRCLVEVDEVDENTFHDSRIAMKEHLFQSFLTHFVPLVARKFKQLNMALWLLETTGSPDAAYLKADLDAEMRFLYNDPKTYEQLLVWDKDPALSDPLLKRQLNVLIRTFKQNNVHKELLEEMAERESALSQSYASFRAEVGGKKVSENDIREILKTETNVEKRKEAWEASKTVGPVLAPQILQLVEVRNKAAKSLGYSDYFQMQLDLQEVDAKWLLSTLDDLAEKSDAAYAEVVAEINDVLETQFHTKELGPWAWSDPFCQEDPLDHAELDSLVKGVDIAEASTRFYERLGSPVREILGRSDMFERPGKSQHAFCLNIDREKDVRTLNNVRSSIQWLDTVLHELGHAIYEMYFDPSLPWLLREPPHMITTEAMALLAGRHACYADSLRFLVGSAPDKEKIFAKSEAGLRRDQLIFSRWVLVMTAFESELYRDPSQDLNKLWWDLVKKYQKVEASQREGKEDWACKYHIGLAPVYYFSYLLGEMFASSIQECLAEQFGDPLLTSPEAGKFLQEKLFSPGNRMPWHELIQHVTGKPLTGDAWVRAFCPQEATRE